MIAQNKKPIKSTITRLIPIIKERKYVALAGIFCMMGYTAVNGSIPTLIKRLVDSMTEISKSNDEVELWRYVMVGLIIVIVFGMRGVFHMGQSFYLNSLGQYLVKNLRFMLFSKVVRLPLGYFQRNKTGEILSRFTNDLNSVEQAVYVSVTGPIRDFPSVLFFLGMLLYINPTLFIFSLLMIPPLVLLIHFFGKRIKKISKQKQEVHAGLVARISETITCIPVVKSFHKEDFEKEKFKEHNDGLFNVAVRTILISAYSVPALEIIAASCIAFMFAVGFYQFHTGVTGLGDFIQFLTTFYLLNEPIKRLNGFNLKLQEGLSAGERVFEVIDIENPIIENNPSRQLPRFKSCLRIKVDRFSYAEKVILKNIDISIPAGSTVAFVGSSGGGKTTLANLIPRFFDLGKEDGAVYFDGRDIREYDVHSLRSQIALVDQNTMLFNDTVKNNIAYGEPGITQEKLECAARVAHAHEFVDSLEKKFEQNIGEKGVLISGGQKQRISIARAVLKNAPILILDEATSSLDSESEQEVQAALDNLKKDRTTLIIAHRFSTIKNVETIFVLKNGEIVETGNHESLLGKQGEYYRLHSLQSISTGLIY